MPHVKFPPICALKCRENIRSHCFCFRIQFDDGSVPERLCILISRSVSSPQSDMINTVEHFHSPPQEISRAQIGVYLAPHHKTVTPNLDRTLHRIKANSPGRKMHVYCISTSLLLFFLETETSTSFSRRPPGWQLWDDSLIRLSPKGDAWERRMFGDVEGGG